MKLRRILLGILSVATLAACEEEIPEMPRLNVDKETITMASTEAWATFNVITNQTWTASPDVEWISLDPSSGSASDDPVRVMITADDNPYTVERKAVITVEAGELVKTLTITQIGNRNGQDPEPDPEPEPDPDPEPEPDPATVTVDTEALTFTYEGGSVSFNVTSNCLWTASDDAEWLTLSPETGEAAESAAVTVTSAENPDMEARTATITITAEGLETPVTVSVSQEAKPAPSEDGTEEKPYLIENLDDLMNMRTLAVVGSTTYFSLQADIDMASVTDWIPVNNDEKFERQIHFEGNNHVISNFSASGYQYSSFFGVLYGSCRNVKFVNADITSDGTSGCGVIGGYIGTTDKPATVENVTIEGVKVYGATALNIGGLAGQLVGSTVKNCTIKDLALSGGAFDKTTLVYYGGLIGQVKGAGSTIEDCHVDGAITTESSNGLSYIGGLIGRIGDEPQNSHTITSCSTDVDIDIPKCAYSGGLLGGIFRSPVTVEKCSTSGLLNGGNNLGGIVGYSEYGTIRDCYTTGSITSSGQGCGGIIGTSYNYSGGTDTSNKVERCYSTSSITTNRGGGGIVGISTAINFTVSDCIAWNSGISASTTNAGHYFTGAIRGGATQNNVCEDCYRRFDLSFSTAVETNALTDDENVNGTSNAKTAYHGKAASEGSTLSDVAESLGWPSDVWDFTDDIPVLQ